MSKTILKGNRYTLELGKFGTFFYDHDNHVNLNNKDVLDLLEKSDGLYKRLNDKFITIDVYLKLRANFIQINSYKDILDDFLYYLINKKLKS